MVTRLPGKTPWWRSQRVCPQHLETEAEWCQDVGRGHWSESSKGKPLPRRCAQAPCPPCAQHPSRSTRRRSCRMRRSGSGSLACPPKNPKGHKGPSHTLTLQGWKLRPGRSRDLSRLHREQIAGLSKPGLPGTAPHVGLGTLPQPPHHARRTLRVLEEGEPVLAQNRTGRRQRPEGGLSPLPVRCPGARGSQGRWAKPGTCRRPQLQQFPEGQKSRDPAGDRTWGEAAEESGFWCAGCSRGWKGRLCLRQSRDPWQSRVFRGLLNA